MPSPTYELLPGLVVRGALAAMQPRVTVNNDRPGMRTIALVVLVPDVGDGRLVEVGHTETSLEAPRDVALRMLRQAWEHEWAEAIELDGVVIGSPH